MNKRAIDPLRLDVTALAKQALSVAGEWALDALPRLAQCESPPHDHVSQPVAWSAQGELRTVAGGTVQIWLHLQSRTDVWLACQRCLQPMRTPLSIERAILFVPGEDKAEALDAEIEDDVLALPAALDLRALVEDELILALPLVPRHDACPLPAGIAPAGQDAGPARPNPFAPLAALKAGRPRG
jgi:uncharacterized protein